MKLSFIMPFFCLTTLSYGQKLTLKINGNSAIKTFEYLNFKKKSIPDIESILKEPGTIGMLNHDVQFDKLMTTENFISEINDSTSTTNAFRFKKIRKDLTNVKETIRLLTDSIAIITKRIESNLLPFTNTIDIKPINIFFVLGGNSDGYSTNDSTFFLELQFYGDDIEGIINIVTHESYHILQERNYSFNDSISSKLSKQDKAAYLLAENIYAEGSASYIANPLLIENPKKYGLFQQEKYNRNIKKLEESFYLFEALLHIAKSKNTKEDLLYNIGYGGEWDSPLYFVGFEICKMIEEKYGRFYVKKYLTISPINLLIDYINLYKRQSDIKYTFTLETEMTIFKLRDKLNKMGYR